MLSQRWSRIIAEIMELYQELDTDVAIFAQKSGMNCVSGCGACCLSPHVETTVAEMLPLAWQLWERNEIEDIIDRLQAGTRTCVQYAADPRNPEKGSCRSYAYRPVLCRLFGYSGSRDKSGQLRYGVCRILQKVEAERIKSIDNSLKQGQLSIPMFASAHERVSEIAGPLSMEMLPLNAALLRAIEWVGLDLQLQETGENSPLL